MFKKSTVFILHFAPSLRFTRSLQSTCYTQSAFYPWSADCSPQSAFYTDRLQIMSLPADASETDDRGKQTFVIIIELGLRALNGRLKLI